MANGSNRLHPIDREVFNTRDEPARVKTVIEDLEKTQSQLDDAARQRQHREEQSNAGRQ